MDQLQEVNFVDLVQGHRYFVIKIGGTSLRIPTIITVAEIERDLRQYEGIGQWGFVVPYEGGGIPSYPGYENIPSIQHEVYRTFGITRFYEVPSQAVVIKTNH